MQPTTWTFFFTGLIASVGLVTARTLPFKDFKDSLNKVR
jgi:hypothetical protein